jgi:hypothetical protein
MSDKCTIHHIDLSEIMKEHWEKYFKERLDFLEFFHDVTITFCNDYLCERCHKGRL